MALRVSLSVLLCLNPFPAQYTTQSQKPVLASRITSKVLHRSDGKKERINRLQMQTDAVSYLTWPFACRR